MKNIISKGVMFLTLLLVVTVIGACGTSGKSGNITPNGEDVITPDITQPVGQKLTITVNGGGNVTSNPAGIDCGAGGTDCVGTFTNEVNVTLTITASEGSRLVNQTDDCGDVVVMKSNVSCSVTFNLKDTNTQTHTLTMTVNGGGNVTSNPAGIDCGAGGTDCVGTFTNEVNVTLTITASEGSRLVNQTGGCENVVVMTFNASCSATFEVVPVIPPDYTVTVQGNIGTGTGSITINPGGIDCGTGCTAVFPDGTEVTLTPAADPGSIFIEWTGDADCSDGVIITTSDKTCIPRFDLKPDPKWIMPKENPEDDVRFSHIAVGNNGEMIFGGRYEDFLIRRSDGRKISNAGGLFFAKFSGNGKFLWSEGAKKIHVPTGNELLRRSWYWSFINGFLYHDGTLFVSYSSLFIPSSMVSAVNTETRALLWRGGAVQHCFHSERGTGIAISFDVIKIPGHGCVIGINNEGVALGQLLPNPVLSTGSNKGKINAIVTDVNGDIHVAATSYADINGTSGYFGGTDSALMGYVSVNGVMTTSAVQWGTGGNENVQDMCIVGNNIFVLTGGDTGGLWKFDLDYNSLGSVDLSAGHIDERMAMYCDATHVYVKSRTAIEKFDVANLTSTWGGSVAVTPTTAPAGSPLDIEISGGTIFVVESTDEILRFSDTDGTPIQN